MKLNAKNLQIAIPSSPRQGPEEEAKNPQKHPQPLKHHCISTTNQEAIKLNKFTCNSTRHANNGDAKVLNSLKQAAQVGSAANQTAKPADIPNVSNMSQQ